MTREISPSMVPLDSLLLEVSTMSQMTKALVIGHKSACRVSGETINYRRGNTVLVAGIVVLPGKTTAEVFDKFGLATTVELQDWIVLQERLKQGETPIVPQRGDIVELTTEGLTLPFAVHHPDGNKPPYRRSDAHGLILRIHTVAVDPIADEPEPDPEEPDAGDE